MPVTSEESLLCVGMGLGFPLLRYSCKAPWELRGVHGILGPILKTTKMDRISFMAEFFIVCVRPLVSAEHRHSVGWDKISVGRKSDVLRNNWFIV